MSVSERWTYSASEDEGWGCFDEYESRDKAVAAAIADPEIPVGAEFFTARAAPPDLPRVDGDWFSEAMGEQAIDDYGEDLVEDWLDPAWLNDKLEGERDSKLAELGESLTKVFHTWLTENKLLPEFFAVGDVEKHRKPL
jgi:hypothetical protein